MISGLPTDSFPKALTIGGVLLIVSMGWLRWSQTVEMTDDAAEIQIQFNDIASKIEQLATSTLDAEAGQIQQRIEELRKMSSEDRSKLGFRLSADQIESVKTLIDSLTTIREFPIESLGSLVHSEVRDEFRKRMSEIDESLYALMNVISGHDSIDIKDAEASVVKVQLSARNQLVSMEALWVKYDAYYSLISGSIIAFLVACFVTGWGFGWWYSRERSTERKNREHPKHDEN